MEKERVTRVVDKKDLAEAFKNKKPGEILVVDMEKENISIDTEAYAQSCQQA